MYVAEATSKILKLNWKEVFTERFAQPHFLEFKKVYQLGEEDRKSFNGRCGYCGTEAVSPSKQSSKVGDKTFIYLQLTK